MTYELLLIKPNGEEKTVTYENEPKLDEYQAMVGGNIEFVNLKFKGKRKDGIVNEEGLIKRLPINHRATKMYQEQNGFSSAPIVGTVVVLKNYLLS